MYQDEIQIRVRYSETDKMGYVYYGNYSAYLEVARVEMLRDLGFSYKKMEEEGIMMPVVDFHITYKKPAFYDDLITIRSRVVNMPGKKIEFEADQVILACGQLIPDADSKEMKELGVISANGWINTDPVNRKTNHEWLFAGGDAAAGPASVIEAVADGEAAAVGINEFLGGEILPFWRGDKPVNTFFDPDADPVEAARREADVLDAGRRKNNFDEVEQPWVEPETILQAKRCLRCDYGRE